MKTYIAKLYFVLLTVMINLAAFSQISLDGIRQDSNGNILFDKFPNTNLLEKTVVTFDQAKNLVDLQLNENISVFNLSTNTAVCFLTNLSIKTIPKDSKWELVIMLFCNDNNYYVMQKPAEIKQIERKMGRDVIYLGFIDYVGAGQWQMRLPRKRFFGDPDINGLMNNRIYKVFVILNGKRITKVTYSETALDFFQNLDRDNAFADDLANEFNMN